ncbi:MAG: site-specific integrase [Nitrososphaerota archaeon]
MPSTAPQRRGEKLGPHKGRKMEDAQSLEKRAAGATETNQGQANIRGKLVEFAWWMKKQGYADSTIQGHVKILKKLVKFGADLYNPESIKEAIARLSCSAGRKELYVEAYSCFLNFIGGRWDSPRYSRVQKLPFIPTEAEIDQLIAGCASTKRLMAFLQLLKETGMRCEEACRLRWTDLDFEAKVVRVSPEKGSCPRVLKISDKLIAMLKALPKTSAKVFGVSVDAMQKSFARQRRKLAKKLENPRLLQITFHTFRHWRATMEYHKTRDILHVMCMLGHKNIKNTLIYTQLIEFKEEEYIAKVAHSEEEICQLVEAGFEYICDYNGNKIFSGKENKQCLEECPGVCL